MSGDILILDDDPEFRAFVSAVLSRQGHRCVEAGDIASALPLLEQDGIHLCVVDGVLPDGTGIGFIEALRARGWGGAVLFLSAFWWDQGTYRLLTEKLGVSQVMQKPVSARELLVQVQAALELVGDETPSPAPAEEDLDQDLSALRRAFTERVDGRITALEQAAADARKGDTDALERLRYAAEKLHGAAGTYDFEQVSAAAGRIERVAEALKDPALPDPRRHWDELTVLLARARAGARVHRVNTPVAGRDQERARVLVVDRSEDLLDKLPAVGRRREVEIVRANDLRETMAVAAEHRLDAAILGVSLDGERDGFEVAAALRSLPGLERLPLAFHADDGSPGNRLASVNAGGRLFLDGPVTPEDVVDVVGTLAAEPEPIRVLRAGGPDSLDAPLERAGFEVHAVDHPLHLLDALARINPDLLIIDTVLPGLSGLDLCRSVRATAGWALLPILLLSDLEGDAARIAALDAGADDALPRRPSGAELIARVRLRVTRARVVTGRLARDPLTGMLARSVFCDYLDARLSEARRRAEALSLALIAVDGYDGIPDRVGHAVRRELMGSIGRILTHRFRKHDLRACWGENRFVLVFLDERPTAARLALTRVLAELRERSFLGHGGRRFRVSCSAGVASFPVAGTSVEELVDAAEAQLLQAFERGGDQVRVR
ncbi:MAG: response regulator [Alphaproteobacteria bacterium]|nr:response regulator [Alphaproteobacteria bacterium]